MDDPLAVYLHDHLAGSSFAVELLEKLASEFTGTSSGDIARELLEQVRIDRSTLEQLIAKVRKATPDLYDALGWIAERMSRTKLKHDDPAGIGALEAFETVSIGILGKRALWEALQVHQNADSRVAGIDYAALIARAEQQFQKANQHRLKLVHGALSKQESQP
jgi:DNA-binding transcriptional ArsR family regulator